MMVLFRAQVHRWRSGRQLPCDRPRRHGEEHGGGALARWGMSLTASAWGCAQPLSAACRCFSAVALCASCVRVATLSVYVVCCAQLYIGAEDGLYAIADAISMRTPALAAM